MIRQTGLLFVYVLTLSRGFSQPSIDSLAHVLSQANQDSNRVNALNALATRYIASQPNQTKQLLEESISLATKINFAKGKALALTELGDYHLRHGNYALAIDYASQSLKVAAQLRDSIFMADNYRLLGNTHSFGLKQYDMAIDYLVKALKIYERRNDKTRMAALCGSITWAYAIVNKNIAEAHRLADKGLAISRELKNNRFISYNLNSKGLLFYKEGKLDSALLNFKWSNEAGELVNDHAVIAYNQLTMGEIYLLRKDYAKAIDLFKQSVALATPLNHRELIKDNYGALARAYEALHLTEDAYSFHKKYTQLKDSLINWETTQKAIFHQLSIDEQLKETKIEQLEKEKLQAKKESRAYLLFFSIIFSLLAIGAGILIRSSRHKRRANLILQEKSEKIETQNQELRQLNSTKDKLFSIIGHDLRGPIASLRSLIGLVVRKEVTSDELQMLAPKLGQNVGSIHETLENLLHWSRSQMEGLTSSPDTINVDGVIKKVLLLFSEMASSKSIAIQYQPSSIQVYADENHMNVILRNLINNALKFTPRGGRVTIAVTHKTDFVEIAVADSGVGISQEQLTKLFRKETHFTSHGTQGEKGTGLGLLLCKEMAEADGGNIRVSSEVGKGSTFYLLLKAKP